MEKDNSSYFKDLIIGISGHLNERLASPLLSSFIISWVLVNYKLIVLIFSEGTFENKFSYISDHLYPTLLLQIGYGFLIPFVLSLIYIYIYPYPAKYVYQHALSKKRELLEIKQTVENETLLTREGSQRIRASMHDLERKIEEQNEQHQNAKAILQAKIAELEKNRGFTGGDIKEASSANLIPQVDLSPDHIRLLNLLGKFENEGRDGIYEKKIRDQLDLNFTYLRILLNDLIEARLINRLPGEEGFIYSLSNQGRKFLH